MKASIIDLRYKTKDIMAALENGEHVTVTERGKERGIIIPVSERTEKVVEDNPFFGMHATDQESVKEIMDELRKDRYDF